MNEREKDSAQPGPSTQNEGKPLKILVVGTDDSFSQQLVEYAVWFAKRMEYGIVALNCVPFGHEAPKVLSPYQKELQKEFETAAAKGAELLAYRASVEDLEFQHMVKVGTPDNCIREAHAERDDLEFVLAEPNACPEVDIEAGIPVFSYHS
jgi:alkanesulfonate monooxygenase SsuD/methylene tetrahydromethanopterin reductase-like flavin-dependent oxidoreductase (luciferase family)